MSTGTRTLTVFLAVLTALFVAIAGVSTEWPGPVWVWPVLLFAAPALVVETVRLVSARRTSLPPEMAPYLPAAPVERRETRIGGVALPSALEDYDFFLSGTVRWSPTGAGCTEPLVNPAGLAVEAVLARARGITERREPGRVSLVQHELNGDLSVMRTEPSGRLRVMAEGITLTLADHDRERLEQLAEVRKEKAVWEHRRKHEQSRREYLDEDVFRDTGSALTWWLARNDEQVEKTVGDIGLIARLTSAVNDTDVPERLRHLVPDPEPSPPVPPETSDEDRPGTEFPLPGPRRSPADHYEDFLIGLGLNEGDGRRALVTQQFAKILSHHGLNETADHLVRRFDPPAGGPFDKFTGEGDPDDPFAGAPLTPHP